MALSIKRIDSIIRDTAAGKRKPMAHGDGGGLYLQAQTVGTSWLFRFTFDGTRRNMGLGAYPDTSLAMARVKAAEQRALVAGGTDPVLHRDALAARLKASTMLTFQDAAERYFREHGSEWTSNKTRWHYEYLMRTYAYPMIGRLPIPALTMDDGLRVLHPFWVVQNISARRLMYWMRAVVDASRGSPGGIDPDMRNPFEWRGGLQHRLPRPSKIHRHEHHASLDYRAIPAHMALLRATEGAAWRMAEMTVLTTVRPGRPIIEMQVKEIDWEARVWDVPFHHEKTGIDHRVPMSNRVFDILRQQVPIDAKPDDLVWPSARTGGLRTPVVMLRVLYAMGFPPGELTQHGFRSSFANWRAEMTDYSIDMQEIALSHAIPGVRGAYQTGKMLERRREMMQAWANFCAGSNVVPMVRAA